jgi:hypothetical protein
MSSAVQTLSSQIPGSFVRKILLLDALTCAVVGLLLVSIAEVLSGLLGLPKNFIFWAGLVLFPCAALMWFTSRFGTKANPPNPLLWIVILGNVAWIIASVLTVTTWFNPTGIGITFVAFQALVVIVLAAFEYRGLRA